MSILVGEEDDWVRQLRDLMAEVHENCRDVQFYHVGQQKTVSCADVCPIKNTSDISLKYCHDNCHG